MDTLERKRLADLIDYVEATERDRFRVVTDVADYRGFRRAADEMALLPGVTFDSSDDDPVWVSVERLPRRAPPPAVDPELALWISLSEDPDARPELRADCMRAELAAANLVGADGDALVRRSDYPHAERLDRALEAYVRELWAPWALEERPRRRAIGLYNALFALRQTLEGASEVAVELVCGIGIARWKRPAATLHHPLLTVPLELTLNAGSHAIELRPRLEAPVGIESDPLDLLGAPGIDEWRRFARAAVDGLESGLSPFAADGYASVLRRAVALIDPDGLYLPDHPHADAPPADALSVGDGWMLLERTRQASQLMDDLEQFRSAIAEAPEELELPGAIRALLVDPDTAPPGDSFPAFRGVSTVPGVTSSDGTGEDLFFPKPFNREQVEVIQRLAVRPGAVVQGPPGTGKTHTIANIISHYLASGKRVLVTSQKAPALKVLRAQLPAAVRPLAVSLLESDRDGLKQFQESVDVIAERLQRTKPAEVQRTIAALDARIDGLHRALAEIDRAVDEIGRTSISAIEIDGERIDPVTAARAVMAAEDVATWLPDPIDVIRSHDPEFRDSDIVALRKARQAVGDMIGYLGLALPDPASLPDPERYAAIHHDLAEAETIRIEIARGDTPSLANGVGADEVARLVERLRDLTPAGAKNGAGGVTWAASILAGLRAGRTDPAVAALVAVRGEIDEIVQEARYFLTRPVDLPEEAFDDPALHDAVGALARGEQVGLFQSLFARQTRARVASIRLLGTRPRDPAGWREVDRFIAASNRARTLQLGWNNAAAQSPLEPVTAAGLGAAEAMREQLDHLDALADQVAIERDLQAAVRQALPGWAGTLADPDAARLALSALALHDRRNRLLNAETARRDLIETLRGIGGALGDGLRRFVADGLGDPAISIVDARNGWQQHLDALAAIRAHAPDFAIIARIAAAIEECGAPLWAAKLREVPVCGIEDPWTPGDWRNRWRLRRLSTWLARIDRHDLLRDQNMRRRGLEDQLRRAYEEAIEQRTWLRLAEKASDTVRSALAAYAQAMRKIGRGTGIRAGRYRRDARLAADRAKNALPCWIMPHYRVSESLPAELGLFDLVIVDEASQSTVAALPALLRARQILIVGDDRQVSPDAGFREEKRLNELAARHLGGQVEGYRAALREDRSLYDLATVAFAGGAIMLREHFRCVAPIIEYSKAQFYSHQLVPLRLPTASERLDPPLIDILVEDGYRAGKVNTAEIDCIVDEIARIAADPAFAGRSIGVTTLLGHEQAAALYAAIELRLGTETILRHDIRVGEPGAFQGDERDIIFISMVADKGSSPLSGLTYEQRFNVAASRARDRMILVRSVELDDLRPADTLRRSLIAHFAAPFAADPALSAERRERCESEFERVFFDRLVERGYRVDTQVRVGNRRIDLVVEGENDRRLAIECDGDAFHGPEQWPDDMARQRMLERAGWTIWRCFASRFVRAPAEVIDELTGVLSERGIFPAAGEDRPASHHVEHRRWRSGDAARTLPVSPAEPVVPHAWLVVADPFPPEPPSIVELTA